MMLDWSFTWLLVSNIFLSIYVIFKVELSPLNPIEFPLGLGSTGFVDVYNFISNGIVSRNTNGIGPMLTNMKKIT